MAKLTTMKAYKRNDVVCGCCCCARSERLWCRCLPYDDGYMIAAQVLSIIAFLMSWLWWVTWVIGLTAMVLIQNVWCCRQAKSGLFLYAGIALAAGLSSFTSGFVVYFLWKDRPACAVFKLTHFDDDYTYSGGSGEITFNDGDEVSWAVNGNDVQSRSYNTYRTDECNEWAYVNIALVETVLWIATSLCIVYFVKSKRFKKQEERLCQEHGLSPPSPGSAEDREWAIKREDLFKRKNKSPQSNTCDELDDLHDDNGIDAIIPMASVSISHNSDEKKDIETGSPSAECTPMQSLGGEENKIETVSANSSGSPFQSLGETEGNETEQKSTVAKNNTDINTNMQISSVDDDNESLVMEPFVEEGSKMDGRVGSFVKPSFDKVEMSTSHLDFMMKRSSAGTGDSSTGYDC